ncbi:MAG: glutamate-5-semialdehyde dehydrogenase [Oscillospiraceae bacterium]
MNYANKLGANAKSAEKYIANASSKQKDAALNAISNALIENSDQIIAQNALDLENAVKSGMSVSMQDRLSLSEARVTAIAKAVLKVIDLPDPIGNVVNGSVRPNGLRISKIHVPLGVIGIIYESRPNVTVDAAVLCLKAGNSVILRGGKEAYYSNKCLIEIMRDAVSTVGFPKNVIQFVDDTSRETSTALMQCNEFVDVIIPRGGSGLIQACLKTATVPVIETGIGNCHVFVDASANLEMAAKIIDNAKTQRPSVCNAIESVLVHKDVAEAFLPMMKRALDEHNVEIRGCELTKKILGDSVIIATETDYATEFLDFILSVKVVNSIDEAIEHISKFSTHHSECIVTESLASSEKFQKEIDAAAVYVNASTRFTDGEEFGFGAEIGISTQKLHARGPMGLMELTSTKYLVNGDGQIR